METAGNKTEKGKGKHAKQKRDVCSNWSYAKL
jgi:hypothetical protein